MVAKRADASADGHLDVLASIPAEYRKAVLEQCERRTLRKGEAIWVQGQPAEFVAFLAEGKAMSSYQSRNGKTGTTGFWCAGDILGAADFGSTTRQQTLRCLGECVIYTLPYSRFNELVRRFPEVGLAVIRALSVRLRWVAQLAVTLETQSAHERICGVLLALVDRFSVPCEQGALIDIKLTNEDLAAIAGVSRQFANGILSDLQRRGLLRTSKRALIVADRDSLERLAYPG
jgi:CRP-like cAMP-binding protein